MHHILFVLFILGPGLLMAQGHHHGYVDFVNREIKALSENEINGYRSGEGMGMALPAELNHYPGPRHVLDMAEELQLSDEQISQTQKLFDEMHENAVRLGKEIVDSERQMNSLFAENKISEKELTDMTLAIGKLQGELRAVHLSAHLKMRTLLTPEQIERYDELRGYKKMKNEK